MKEISFAIQDWKAWAPGLEDADDWKAWSTGQKQIIKDKILSPKLDFLNSMQRRRLSQLTKMSLRVAYDCIGFNTDIESVFASRYGEWGQTLELLKLINNTEDLSPAGFSLSVHNTSAGMYSLTSKSKSSYSAIAGGEFTFVSGLMEALGRLTNNDSVLLVFSDEDVPELYQKTFSFPNLPFAFALLLGKEGSRNFTLKKSILPTTLPLTQSNSSNTSLNSTLGIDTLDFLHWYLVSANKSTNEKSSFKLNSLNLEIREEEK